MQNAGRDQPQHSFFAIDDQRVAGVVTALKAHHAMHLLSEPVNDFSLTFVTPLGADDDDVTWHVNFQTSDFECEK